MERRGNIWDLPHYLNHFLYTQSSKGGWTQKLQLPGLIEKANTWAQVCLLCAVPMKDRNNCNIRGARHQGCSCFRAVLLKSREKELLQLTLTISRLTLQSSRIHTVDWCFFKNVWNYCNLFPSCTLLFKPFRRNYTPETSLVVKRLRLHVPNTGRGPGSIPDQGTSSHVPQLTILHGAAEAQPNK